MPEKCRHKKKRLHTSSMEKVMMKKEEGSLEKFLEQDSKKQGSLLPYLLNLY